MSKIINKNLMLSIKNKILSSIQYTFEKLVLRIHLTFINNNNVLYFFDKNKWIPFANKCNYCIKLLTDYKKEIQIKALSTYENFVRKKNNEFNLVIVHNECIPEVFNRENTNKNNFFFIYLALYVQNLSFLESFHQRLLKKVIIII